MPEENGGHMHETWTMLGKAFLQQLTNNDMIHGNMTDSENI